MIKSVLLLAKNNLFFQVESCCTTLHDDEDVIDADAEEEEGDDDGHLGVNSIGFFCRLNHGLNHRLTHPQPEFAHL